MRGTASADAFSTGRYVEHSGRLNYVIDANAVRNGSSPYAHIIEISNGYGMVSPVDEGTCCRKIEGQYLYRQLVKE